ncbi:metallophosphoesterase family protein [Bacillaceae bacterium SIJ1]|uniref:metallophosphoesterase family protein n=1 Tax=Litoribacterium kuwaitense TaxID=1398745 RepID=UPI0013EA4FC2|nr:metallophosphoesterase family protein [Litoribacterium kuwaitense]NGP46201.1 metallophosphoesterase family protein [Litoribacterium kuwaitense]
MKLTMTPEGKFTILQLTDLHIGPFPYQERDQYTIKHIKEMVSLSKPDLIVITGDLIWSEGVQKPQESYGGLIEVINQLETPVAITYGNHDSEENITRKGLREMEKRIHQLADKKHVHLVDDRASFCIEVTQRDGSLANVLYLIDSGDYDPLKIGTYDYVHPDQVAWFNEISKMYSDMAKDFKQNLLFLHIPLPEYRDGFLNGRAQGTKLEDICPPRLNTGLFTSLLIDGNVAGVFCGHDHDNDFVADYHGIQLGYGRVSGYNTYGELKRGARVIELFADQPMKTKVIETEQAPI